VDLDDFDLLSEVREVRRTGIATGAIEFRSGGKSVLGKKYYDDIDFLWGSFVRAAQYVLLRRQQDIDWAGTNMRVRAVPDLKTDCVVLYHDNAKLFAADRLDFVITVAAEAESALRAIANIYPKLAAAQQRDIQIAKQLWTDAMNEASSKE
jgi:hypothetical protein